MLVVCRITDGPAIRSRTEIADRQTAAERVGKSKGARKPGVYNEKAVRQIYGHRGDVRAGIQEQMNGSEIPRSKPRTTVPGIEGKRAVARGSTNSGKGRIH